MKQLGPIDIRSIGRFIKGATYASLVAQNEVDKMIDVGKLFIDRLGAGRLYIPKTILESVNLSHKDKVKLEIKEGKILVTPLRDI